VEVFEAASTRDAPLAASGLLLLLLVFYTGERKTADSHIRGIIIGAAVYHITLLLAGWEYLLFKRLT
jgi:hypothetical protein